MTGEGATADGSVVTITAAGAYSLSGTLDDGQVIVNAGDDDKVTLILNGVTLASSITAPIYVANADKTIINVAGGNDGSAMGRRPGQNEFAASDEYHLTINGGYVVVDAGGDGLDSNGHFDMTGGLVIVNGPTNNGTFNISGGTLVAAGSSGMAQAPSTSSTQYSVMYNFDSMQAAGTMVHIATADGQEVLSFVPAKEYQSVLLSSPMLEDGETYTFYTGGSSTGAATDGLYSGGVYTVGTEIASLTAAGVVTSGGVQQRGGGGGPPPGGRP